MTTTRCKIFIALLFVAYTSLCLAQDVLFKWIDDEGVVHYTDSPENIPDRFRGQVEQKTMERIPAPTPRAETPVPAPAVEEKASAPTDVKGQDKEWWLGQKKYWRDEIDRLKAQIEKNKEDMGTLRQKRVRRGTRTKEGITLGVGPRIEERDELRWLQKITPELESKLKQAQYMLEEGLVRAAHRAGVPLEWIEEMKK